MKTNVRNEDAIARAMGWLGQLREDVHAEPVFPQWRRTGHGRESAMPVERHPPPPQSAADPTARPSESERPEMCESAEIIQPAPIGDSLRIPIAWCEMGSCISHYSHPAALGEADIRARAIAAGWRVDALGRLACPQCLRSGAWFWNTHPVVRWDRARAVSTATLMTAAAREAPPAALGTRPEAA